MRPTVQNQKTDFLLVIIQSFPNNRFCTRQPQHAFSYKKYCCDYFNRYRAHAVERDNCCRIVERTVAVIGASKQGHGAQSPGRRITVGDAEKSQLPTLHCTVIGLTRERFVALGLGS